MKYLLMLAFVISCSSHHHDPSPAEAAAAAAAKSTFKADAGTPYASFESALGKPSQCVEFADHKYCEWGEKKQINFFKGDKFVSEVKAPSQPFNYNIDRECMSGDQKSEKTVQPIPGAKRLSVSSLEWKRFYPQIEKTLKASGLQVGKSAQQLKINYGLKELPGSTVKRYLSFSAVQKNEELWKVNVSSKGTSRDLNQVMPILLLASYDLVSEPSNETKSMIISDSSLHVIGFRHFLQSK